MVVTGETCVGTAGRAAAGALTISRFRLERMFERGESGLQRARDGRRRERERVVGVVNCMVVLGVGGRVGC